jgi:adenine-specific DNA-methyltransferase
VQIGDENVHRVCAVMDEVFGPHNHLNTIFFHKTTGDTGLFLNHVGDYILWYAKDMARAKYRQLYFLKKAGKEGASQYIFVQEGDGTRRPASQLELSEGSPDLRFWCHDNMTSQKPPGDFPVKIGGRTIRPSSGYWKTGELGMERLNRGNRLMLIGNTLRYIRYLNDFHVYPVSNVWEDTVISGFGVDKIYVVFTLPKVIERCILMASDPGDLVLDPTCGSGTTAYVAEQWGRRWITIDTSRVALALARTRLMAARYPWYLLADSPEGRRKEAKLTGKPPLDGATRNDLRQGFVYEHVPHITLKSIANNSRIDDIWKKRQATLEPLRASLNAALGRTPSSLRGGEADEAVPSGSPPCFAPRDDSQAPWEEWQIPRETGADWPANAVADHAAWWEARIARQTEIDAAIAQAAEVERLYDRPYPDPSRVRVAGPFTVESLSPHRIVAADENELIDEVEAAEGRRKRTGAPQVDFSQIVIDYLKSAGIHQSDKSGKIDFESVTPWPGQWIGAEARFRERDEMRRAAILIGPEYGTVSRPDLTAAAREANEARFDLLIACAFNFDAHSSELYQLGPLPILKARMNPDLHMSDELKNTGKGNLFVIFGEPDIRHETLDTGELRVTVRGIDVYDPNTGDIRSNDVRDIAAWFIDTDYNEESFFVRHAYFLGANEPYKALKTALRAEIDEEAWSTLYRATSRPFPRPRDGVIAVKVINHFGDEVMKVYRV